jgi:hypothetical protein
MGGATTTRGGENNFKLPFSFPFLVLFNYLFILS